MKPVVKLVMFVKKLYHNGWPNFQVPLLNGNWLGEEKKKGEKKRKEGVGGVSCSSVTGRFHCTPMIVMTNISLTSSVMITNEQM